MCDMVGQYIQKKEEKKQIKEEQVAKARYWKIPICYDDNDDEDYTIAITPKEPDNSLIIGDEHLDTILATKSEEFIKSSVENLVPNPSESEGEYECDEIYSNPLFDEKIISMKVDLHHFNAEFDLIESMLNHDSPIISSSSKIDSLLDEFAGKLTLLKSIPPGINETDCNPKEETRLIKILLYDNSSPRPPKEFISENFDIAFESFSPYPIPVEDSDSFVNNSLSLPENESFHFDISSSSHPPAKPPDGTLLSWMFHFSISIPLDKLNIPENLKTHAEGFCPSVFISSASLGNQEYLLEFTFKYSILEELHSELPGPEERIVDFPKGKQETREKHPLMLYQTFGFPEKLEQLILLGGREDMDLFNLIRALNSTKVKTGTRPRAAHEVPLLTVTTSCVIEMKDLAAEKDSYEAPSTIKRSPLDFANENPSQQSTGGNEMEDQGQKIVAPKVPSPENVTTTRVSLEAGLVEEIAAMGPRVIKERRKRGNDGVDMNAPPKVLRKDHANSRPMRSTVGGKSLTSMGLGTRFLVDVSDPDWLSFANPQSIPTKKCCPVSDSSSNGAAIAGDLESENTSFTSMVGSPESIYQPEWGVTNGYRLDAPEAYQDLLWLRFKLEAKLLKKPVAQVARRDQRIQAIENEIKNLEALLEAETGMKKSTEAKNAELEKELENLRALFSDLQVSNDRLSQQVFDDVVSTGIAKGMNEGLKYGLKHGKANLDLEAIEAYDPEADTKYIASLHALRDLKYPMVDQLECLKDVLIDVRDPKDPLSFKEEILLVDAIPINVSRAEKKKRCQVVCRTHGVGFAHHARSDGVLVSVPTVTLQGLTILLVNAATQAETSKDGASPAMYNLD
uniref:Transposase (Putative), gypsy type n=1 Tax=Tanacetum cinerariifolium TaxID=118510 RepID=A0A6L2N4B6_TANCI|nr:hypothetical protein [Tanacetum cinerariifolium]